MVAPVELILMHVLGLLAIMPMVDAVLLEVLALDTCTEQQIALHHFRIVMVLIALYAITLRLRLRLRLCLHLTAAPRRATVGHRPVARTR